MWNAGTQAASPVLGVICVHINLRSLLPLHQAHCQISRILTLRLCGSSRSSCSENPGGSNSTPEETVYVKMICKSNLLSLWSPASANTWIFSIKNKQTRVVIVSVCHPLDPLFPLGRCPHPLVYFLRPRLFGEPSLPYLSFLPQRSHDPSFRVGSPPFPSRTSFHPSLNSFLTYNYICSLFFHTWIKQSSPLNFLMFYWHPWFSCSWIFPAFFPSFPSLSVQTCFILVFLTSLRWLPLPWKLGNFQPSHCHWFSHSALKTLAFFSSVL